MKPRTHLTVEEIVSRILSLLFALGMLGVLMYLLFTKEWAVYIFGTFNIVVITILSTLIFREIVKLLTNRGN